MGGMMMGCGSMELLMMASLLLVVAGAVLLLVWVVRRLSSGTAPAAGPPNNTPQETPLEIAQRRYARGEIGPEEYERTRSNLMQDVRYERE